MNQEQNPASRIEDAGLTAKHCALGTVAMSAFVGLEAGLFVGIGEATDKSAMVHFGQDLAWGSVGLAVVGASITAGVALRNKIVTRRRGTTT